MRAVKVIIFVEGSRAHFTSPIIVNITLFRVFFPSKIPLPFLRNRCIPPEGCPHKFVLGFVHHTVKSIRWNMRFGWIESADDIRVVFLLSCLAFDQHSKPVYSKYFLSGSVSLNSNFFSSHLPALPIIHPLTRAQMTVPILTPSNRPNPKNRNDRIMPMIQLIQS